MNAFGTILGKLEPWIWFYSYGLIAIFALGLWALLSGTLLGRRRLAMASRVVSGLVKSDPINGATERDYKALVSAVEGLPDQGGKWWSGVRASLTRHARPGVPAAKAGYYVTERTEDAITDARAFGDSLRAFAHVTPAVLTSLGLLGTFIALLFGLNELERNAEGIWSIDSLLYNLSGKFVTSILALALSVLFILIEQGLRPAVANAKRTLADELSAVLPWLSTAHVLLDLQQQTATSASSLAAIRDLSAQQAEEATKLRELNEQQVAEMKALQQASEEQALQLQRFNTDIAVAIGTAMDARIVPALERLLEGITELKRIQARVGEELVKEVGQQISGAVSAGAGKEMGSMAEAVRQGASTLNTAAQAMGEGQARLIEVTSAVIGQMNSSFDQRSKRLTDETESAVQRLVAHLEGAAGGFSKTIGGASNDVSKTLKSTTASLGSVADACREILLNTDVALQRFDALVTKVSAATQEMAGAHTALKGTAVPLQQLAERTTAAVGSVERQVAVIGGAGKSLEATSAMLNEMQQKLQTSWASYEQRFAGVDASLGKSLEGMTRGFDLYAEKIGELNAGLDKHFSRALTDLSSAVAELHESVEDLAAASQSRPPQGPVRR